MKVKVSYSQSSSDYYHYRATASWGFFGIHTRTCLSRWSYENAKAQVLAEVVARMEREKRGCPKSEIVDLSAKN